jgi:hypothetical protein
MSKSGPRSRAAHPSSTLYGDVETATQDAYRIDPGFSEDDGPQPQSTHGGNGVSDSQVTSCHGGNGSHRPGSNHGGLADWGRRHSGGFEAGSRTDSGNGGSDEGRGLLHWQADEPGGEAEQQAGKRPWWRGASSGVALICLLLTMASFMVPESEQGIGMVMKHVRSTSANAKVEIGMHATVDQPCRACLSTANFG